MAKPAMNQQKFESLLSSINQETTSNQRKLEILFRSKSFFSANQASRLLYAYAIPSDKVKAIQILEPRLSGMTCSEARDVLGAFSIHNDRHVALDCVKRVLSDYQTREGQEQILGAFPFENDKFGAVRTLHTVRSDAVDAVPAGGHQGYAALGGLYTQCRPLVPHLYGSVEYQQSLRPGKGEIQIPVMAKPGMVPSMYTGHPSYAYAPGRDYARDRGYPGAGGYATEEPMINGPSYPAGAPPLGMHQGAPAPTGFPGLRS